MMHIMNGLMVLGMVSMGRAQECDPSRTLKVDAIELVAGREVPGREDLFTDRGRFRYLFSTEANRAAFDQSSERFEIQLGGACARMGPLSGDGSTKRYAVYDGRIYLFASDACKARFLTSPSDFLYGLDPVPQADAESVRRGRELIERAVKGSGGAKSIDDLTSFRADTVTSMKEGGKDYINRKAWIVRFPEEFRLEDNWNESTWAAVAAKDEAFFVSREVWTMHPQQRAALESEFRRLPLVILRARERNDFTAIASGEGNIGGAPVEYVTVAFAGTTTKLGVDTKSGRIVSTAYRGRGPKQALGELQLVFSDFKRSGELELPMAVEATFNTEPASEQNISYAKIAVNEDLDEALFRRP